MGGNTFPGGAPSVPHPFHPRARAVPSIASHPRGGGSLRGAGKGGGTQRCSDLPGHAKPGTDTGTSRQTRASLPFGGERGKCAAPTMTKIQGHKRGAEFEVRIRDTTMPTPPS